MTIITMYIATGTLNESAPDMNVALNLADTYPLSRPQRIARIRSIPLVDVYKRQPKMQYI